MASTDRGDGVGFRVAQIRIAAEMTQEELAARLEVSKPYVSMIETGKRPVSTRRLLDGLAAALHVSTNDLTGQPYLPVNTTDLEAYQVVPQVRAALEDPEDDEPLVTRTLEELELAVDRAMKARMNCDVPALGRYLPAALAELRHLWFHTGDRTAGELLVKAAVTGCLALKAAGWIDLGIRLAKLADTVAKSHGDPVCVAAARFAVAQCALSTGNRRRSARIAVAGAEELDRMTRQPLPPRLFNDVLSWMGVLHLHAALSEATLEGGDSHGHLTAAAAAATRVIGDPWRMEFGSANVQVWEAGITLELGDADLVPQLARRVEIEKLKTKQRRSRLWLDTGRAAHATGDYPGAIKYLLRADDAAPGDLRSRPTAVETVGHIVRESGVRSEQLRDLAVRVGIPIA